jgi:tetratricopeptide (TPR) repeat protein
MRVGFLICALSVSALAASGTGGTSQIPANEADRRSALTHYRSGQELLAAEQFAKAADAFSAAIALEPLLTDAHYGLGQAYMGLERFASAIQAFGRTIEAARALHDLRNRDRVAADRAIDDELRELRDTLRRRKDQPLRVMQLEARISEVERSRSSLGQPFETPASVLLALGSAHYRNGDADAAEQHWSSAVRVNSKLGEAWNNLAVVYMTSGRKQDAEAAIKNAELAGFRVNPRLKDKIRSMP